MFRTLPLSIIKSFSMHTQRWYTLKPLEQDQAGTDSSILILLFNLFNSFKPTLSVILQCGPCLQILHKWQNNFLASCSSVIFSNALCCMESGNLLYQIFQRTRNDKIFFFYAAATLIRVLAFSTISFHLRRSCTFSAYFVRFIFFRSFLTSSSNLDLGLPAGLPVNGFHLSILFTMLVSGILFMCPNQLSCWDLT